MSNSGTQTLRPWSLGEALLLLRSRGGLSQDELAERAGVKRTTYSRWETESGSKPPDAASLRGLVSVLAQTLGLDQDELWVEFGELMTGLARRARLNVEVEVITQRHRAASTQPGGNRRRSDRTADTAASRRPPREPEPSGIGRH